MRSAWSSTRRPRLRHSHFTSRGGLVAPRCATAGRFGPPACINESAISPRTANTTPAPISHHKRSSQSESILLASRCSQPRSGKQAAWKVHAESLDAGKLSS